MKIGYARVSSNNQDLELQIEALVKAGCAKIYSEAISGKDNHRTQLRAMLENLRANDVSNVCKLIQDNNLILIHP